jgi:hypothetical protein
MLGTGFRDTSADLRRFALTPWEFDIAHRQVPIERCER